MAMGKEAKISIIYNDHATDNAHCSAPRLPSSERRLAVAVDIDADMCPTTRTLWELCHRRLSFLSSQD